MIRQSMIFSAGLMAFIASAEVSAARNVVFLNNPSPQNVSDIGRYVVRGTGQPFFSELVLFAANINGSSPSTPVLAYNAEMTAILRDNIQVVRQLQNRGIKVQISYLGNHQNAGWSCNMSAQVAGRLGDAMVAEVVKYGLDGINVDDEYSTCSGNAAAFYKVLRAIRVNPYFSGKALTKALWTDSQYFRAPNNAATQLTQGYEMTYNGNVGNLQPYVGYGMSKSALYLGISPQFTSTANVRAVAQSVVNGGYAGTMVWAPNAFFNTTQAAAYYTQIARAQIGASAVVDYVP